MLKLVRIIGFIIGFAVGSALAAEAPKRVVSLNLCTDQLALALADKEQLLAVSFNAANPQLSSLHESAKGLPLLKGDMEEVLLLDPDLVLLGEGQMPQLQAWLKQKNIPLLTLPSPASIDDINDNIMAVAEALGEKDKGQDLVTAQRFAITRARLGKNMPRTAVYFPRGFTSGKNTWMDDLLGRIGARHLGAENLWQPAHYVSLEEMVSLKPDLLLMQEDGGDRVSEGEALLRHPALEKAAAHRVGLPGAWMACPHLNLGHIATQIYQGWQGQMDAMLMERQQ